MWHLPLFFIPECNQYGQNFLFFTVSVIGLCFMLSAVRKFTGSVWLCALCHMTVNAIPEVIHYDVFGKTSVIITGIMIITSAVLVKMSEMKKRI